MINIDKNNMMINNRYRIYQQSKLTNKNNTPTNIYYHQFQIIIILHVYTTKDK